MKSCRSLANLTKPTNTSLLQLHASVTAYHFLSLSEVSVFTEEVSLLDEAEAVDHFVKVEVGVLPRLHGGLLSLQPRHKMNTDLN